MTGDRCAECGKHDPARWDLVCRRPLGHAGLHDWEAPYGPGHVDVAFPDDGKPSGLDSWEW